MAEYWLREANRWRSLKSGDTLPTLPSGQEDMFVGMAQGPDGTQATWDATEAEWGGIKSGIARTYSSGLPSSAPESLSRHFGVRASWHSMKADWAQMASGALDATVTSFLNSIPANHDLLLTFAHEPENDNPSGSGAANGNNPAYNTWVAEYAPRWRAAQAHFYDLVKSVRPQTWVGPILMGWTFDTGSNRNYQDWTPPTGKMDFFGLDPYQSYLFPPSGSPTNWDPWAKSSQVRYQNWCDSLGVVGAIGETACAEHLSDSASQRKIAWMWESFNWCKNNNYLAYCWFNVNNTHDMIPSMLLNSSPQVLSTWATILSDHRRGVVNP